jgi:hypothetical protein
VCIVVDVHYHHGHALGVHVLLCCFHSPTCCVPLLTLLTRTAVDETDLFVDNEQSISVNTTSMMQSLPAQLRLTLAQQHHHHNHNQQHQHPAAAAAAAAPASAAAAGVLEGGSPVSAAAAAAAVSTMRRLVKQVSGRSRERGSSGGGADITPRTALGAAGATGSSAAPAVAPRVSDSSLPVTSSCDNDPTQPLLSPDLSSRS